MASRGQAGAVRGRTLGTLPGRLRGGFSASPIPGGRSGDDILTQSAISSPSPTLASGNGENSRLQTEGTTLNINTVSEFSSVLASMTTNLRTILATTKKMERKITNVEQKQVQLAESVKELHTVMKRQEKENFSIKGSTWEVRERW